MSITEKDKDVTADYKDTEVTAFLKKSLFVFWILHCFPLQILQCAI